ncbi:MAG: hypothetical protein M3346_08365 [Actinomycetota bacterium]|nr:hypothetical protein [Actinomycetota bacterium]
MNRSDSEWCGQCFAPLTTPESTPAPTTAATLEPGSRRAEDTQPIPGLGDRHADPGPRGDIFSVEEGGGVSWQCGQCATTNSLDADACTACGTSFVSTMKPPEQVGPERDPGTAAMLSLFMPGAGHGYLGLWGQAVARAVLGLWVSGIVLLAGLQDGAGSGLIAIVFGAASFGLWIVTAHDAYREAVHDPGAVILKGRTFLFTVLALLVMLLGMLVASGLRAGAA